MFYLHTPPPIFCLGMLVADDVFLFWYFHILVFSLRVVKERALKKTKINDLLIFYTNSVFPHHHILSLKLYYRKSPEYKNSMSDFGGHAQSMQAINYKHDGLVSATASTGSANTRNGSAKEPAIST